MLVAKFIIIAYPTPYIEENIYIIQLTLFFEFNPYSILNSKVCMMYHLWKCSNDDNADPNKQRCYSVFESVHNFNLKIETHY